MTNNRKQMRFEKNTDTILIDLTATEREGKKGKLQWNVDICKYDINGNILLEYDKEEKFLTEQRVEDFLRGMGLALGVAGWRCVT